MIEPITFFVPGKAETAGSKRSFIMKIKGTAGTSPKHYRAIVTDDNPNGEKWKKKVDFHAREAYRGEPLKGPLQLDVTFILERPQSHHGTGKNSETIKNSAPTEPTTRPDTTKLLRCLEDALTHVLWEDDAQIVLQIVRKRYGGTPGASVSVGPYQDDLF